MKNEMTFQEILKNKFQLRLEKNKKYSMRSFAVDLGISVSLLSEVLSGKKGLSPKKAELVSKKLEMSEIEKGYFCDLVTVKHARNEGSKILAQDRLEGYKKLQITSLTLDSFSLIHEWYYFALLELTHIESFVSSVDWVATKLNVPENKIKAAVERLENLGLLEIDKDGNWIDTQADLATPDGFSFSYLRKFHKQLIEKSILALEEQTVDERDISSLLVSVDSKRLPEAKKRIREFKKEFIQEFNNANEDKDSVYCLGIQLFNVAKEKNL